MGAAAFALQEQLVASATDLLGELDPILLEAFSIEWRGLTTDVRRTRPKDGSDDEEIVIKRMAILSAHAMRVFGGAFALVFRNAVNAALGALLSRELSAAETERKLALRQIEQAAHTYGVFVESIGTLLDGVPPDDIAALIDESVAEVEKNDIQPSAYDRVMLRFQLDFAVALDSLDAPLDELTYWAFRAATGARRVETIPPPIPHGLRGDLARLRAKRSWLGWDAAEIKRELEPWPPPARPQ